MADHAGTWRRSGLPFNTSVTRAREPSSVSVAAGEPLPLAYGFDSARTDRLVAGDVRSRRSVRPGVIEKAIEGSPSIRALRPRNHNAPISRRAV